MVGIETLCSIPSGRGLEAKIAIRRHFAISVGVSSKGSVDTTVEVAKCLNVQRVDA